MSTLPSLAYAVCLMSAAAVPAAERLPTVTPFESVTVTFAGPEAEERGAFNPFRDVRCDVTVATPDGRSLVVPGHFAADGDAAESGADAGNRWRAHYTPDVPGEHVLTVELTSGEDAAIAGGGEPCGDDGRTFAFDVAGEPLTSPNGLTGIVRYDGDRYLVDSGTGEAFVKCGVGSPENLLGYADFDATYSYRRVGKPKRAAKLHRYESHVGDWRTGDPTWRGGKGKGLIGAMNYLASVGVNDSYFVVMNVGGDGKDCWPFVDHETFDRYDVSKLDQWEIVFAHMDRLGICLNVYTQETENDQLLDGGDLGPTRKLYYRELVSRFGHHRGVTWNLGEETSNTVAERNAFAAEIARLDVYGHPIAVHTFANQIDEVYPPHYGDGNAITTAAVQTSEVYENTVKLVTESAASGKPWVVSHDEVGPASAGAVPDENDPGRDYVRRTHLWPHLMAGGSGPDWYFGYRFKNSDLSCEDFRSRDLLFKQTKIAVDLFRRAMPFERMRPAPDRLDGPGYCLAEEGRVYAVYMPHPGWTQLTLDHGATYDVTEYDTVTGERVAKKRLDVRAKYAKWHTVAAKRPDLLIIFTVRD